MLLGGRKLFTVCACMCMCVSYSHPSDARSHTGFYLGLVLQSSTFWIFTFLCVFFTSSDFFFTFNTITDKKKSLLLSSFHLFPFPSILSHSVYFWFYFWLSNGSLFDFKFLCMYANTVTHLILFFSFFFSLTWMGIHGTVHRIQEKFKLNPTYFSLCVASTAQTAA